MPYKNQYVGGLWSPVKFAALRYEWAPMGGFHAAMNGAGGSLRNATIGHALPAVLARPASPQSPYLRPANGGGMMDIFKSALNIGKDLWQSFRGTNTKDWTYLRPG